MTAQNEIRAFVERIERLEEEIKASNSDKSDIYQEAKSRGYDVKALKTVVAKRRKDPDELTEHEALVDVYWAAVNSGTPVATRARTTQGKPEPVSASPEKPVFIDVSRPDPIVSASPAADFEAIPTFLDRRPKAQVQA